MSHDAGDFPPGFARDVTTGLVVPAGSRPLEQETWTHEEARVFARAQTAALQRGIAFSLYCPDPRCAAAPLIHQTSLPDGSFSWRCLHKDRVVRKLK